MSIHLLWRALHRCNLKIELFMQNNIGAVNR
jgi:hypothetical protein